MAASRSDWDVNSDIIHHICDAISWGLVCNSELMILLTNNSCLHMNELWWFISTTYDIIVYEVTDAMYVSGSMNEHFNNYIKET